MMTSAVRVWARCLATHTHPQPTHSHVQALKLNAIHATDGAHDSHDAARPPLVMLHGLLGSSTNFRSLMPKISLEAKRKVWAVDLRNHGQSPHSDVMTYDAMCADLDLFFHDHGLKKVVLLGHSLGGKVAMAYAARHPNTLSKLIVVDIAPKSYPHEGGPLGEVAAVIKALNEVPLATTNTRQQAEAFLAPRIHNATVRNFALLNFTPGQPSTWRINLPAITHFMGSLAETPFGPNAQYKGPTMFLYGSKSPYVRLPADKAVINAHFPHAMFAELTAGHWVHHEQPAAFVHAIGHFLRDTHH